MHLLLANTPRHPEHLKHIYVIGADPVTFRLAHARYVLVNDKGKVVKVFHRLTKIK